MNAAIMFCVQIVAEHIPKLVQGVRDYVQQPDNLGVQLALINASQHFIQVKFCTVCLLKH